MRIPKIAALTVAALLSSNMIIAEASAMPMNGPVSAATQIADSLQDVRWVCGPYRCWWRPGPYWRGPYWGPPYPYWGWRRWRWHRYW